MRTTTRSLLLYAIILLLVLTVAFATAVYANEKEDLNCDEGYTPIESVIADGLSEWNCFHPCNDTAIWSNEECKSCAVGWVKVSPTKCDFSKECLDGFIYDPEQKYCVQTTNSTFTCATGYHLQQLPNRTKIYDNETGLTTYEEYECVPNGWWSDNWWKLIIITILILTIIIYYIKKKER